MYLLYKMCFFPRKKNSRSTAINIRSPEINGGFHGLSTVCPRFRWDVSVYVTYLRVWPEAACSKGTKKNRGVFGQKAVVMTKTVYFTTFVVTRWAPTSYKWSYNPYKWPYKWVTGVIIPINGVITLLITGWGPTLYLLLDIYHESILMNQLVNDADLRLYPLVFQSYLLR